MRRDKMLQVLERHHNRVRRVVSVVWATRDIGRQDAVSSLVTLLALHLTAEEDLAAAGLEEIDRLVDELRQADIQSTDFILTLGQLEDLLEDHATSVEGAMRAAVGEACTKAQFWAACSASSRLVHIDDWANVADLRAIGRLEGPAWIPFAELRALARCRPLILDRDGGRLADATA